MVQFPPPFTEKTNIHLPNIFNAQTSFFFTLAYCTPLNQMVFSFEAIAFPKEGSSLLVKTVSDSFR